MVIVVSSGWILKYLYGIFMRGLFLVGKFPLSPSHSSFSDIDNDSVGRKRRRKSLKVKMGRRKNSFWQPNSDFNHFSQYVPLVYINLCIKNSKLTLNSIIYLSMLLCGINKKFTENISCVDVFLLFWLEDFVSYRPTYVNLNWAVKNGCSKCTIQH